ncbi:fimbrial biogenesis outer membrane usher protein [Pseudomonas sp. 1912-s]|uniref:fimbria/pilus outer membrane usher protein n=1 Tax=Pseudomonas sp. 1912-s TaxID=3033802 RepID=UPI0023DFFFEA|nr:fimbria/pilus outer membrane usher protein [Pseudomonas sp. 1912-s]MDF3201800.1 fimbrial biogenesis outer membrane usher protein [Pseudomonas sp. 1912-s]
MIMTSGWHDLPVRRRFALNLRTRPFLKIGVTLLLAFEVRCVLAEDTQFNSAFLPEGSRALDLTPYQKGNPVLTGDYRSDISINGQLVGRQNISIHSQPDGSAPTVCFNRVLLQLVGVDFNHLSASANQALENNAVCLNVASLIDDASATFLPETQTLDVSIPQVALRRDAHGYVSPELWDRGVTAGILGYNLNTNQSKTNTGNYDSAYLGLNVGLNLADWRLRHDGSVSWQQNTGRTYQTLDTYAQRDITAWKSQLTLGEASTSGEIFDTLSFKGVRLSSDDRMLPESMRGYAPVIRGIARTNARVAIRQSGNLLQETTVAPGAFVIDDLYSSGYGGDLDVTVYEADGSEQHFTVPYASVAQLLRPGTTRYSLTIGETRDNYVTQQAKLFQGTLQYGLSNTFTGYSGLQASDNYSGVLAGLALGTPIGALAADITHASTDLEGKTQQGQSVRLTYSKNFLSSGSNFSVAAYRFSTSGFMDFDTAMQTLDAARNGTDINQVDRPRSRLSLTADQSLGGWGQVALSGSTQSYWNRQGNDMQYQFNYSKQLRRCNYSFSATRSRFSEGGMENNLLFSISMPVDFFSTPNTPQLTARLSRDTSGNYSPQATVSGSAGADRQYSYSVTADRDGTSNTSNTSLNGQYTSSSALVGGTISHGAGYDSLSLNASGSVVAHPGGITLTPYRGETMAVVSAPGAEGAKVVGYPGLKLDSGGNAIVPYLRPYELNEVAIDPIGTSKDIEFSETSQQVAPRSGAVVSIKYGTSKGKALLLNVKLSDSNPLPFGSSVTDITGKPVGIVGQRGQLYARINEDVHILLITWGSKDIERCSLALPPALNDGKQLQEVDALCSTETLSARPVAGISGATKQ